MAGYGDMFVDPGGGGTLTTGDNPNAVGGGFDWAKLFNNPALQSTVLNLGASMTNEGSVTREMAPLFNAMLKGRLNAEQLGKTNTPVAPVTPVPNPVASSTAPGTAAATAPAAAPPPDVFATNIEAHKKAMTALETLYGIHSDKGNSFDLIQALPMISGAENPPLPQAPVVTPTTPATTGLGEDLRRNYIWDMDASTAMALGGEGVMGIHKARLDEEAARTARINASANMTQAQSTEEDRKWKQSPEYYKLQTDLATAPVAAHLRVAQQLRDAEVTRDEAKYQKIRRTVGNVPLPLELAKSTGMTTWGDLMDVSRPGGSKTDPMDSGLQYLASVKIAQAKIAEVAAGKAQTDTIKWVTALSSMDKELGDFDQYQELKAGQTPTEASLLGIKVWTPQARARQKEIQSLRVEAFKHLGIPYTPLPITTPVTEKGVSIGEAKSYTTGSVGGEAASIFNDLFNPKSAEPHIGPEYTAGAVSAFGSVPIGTRVPGVSPKAWAEMTTVERDAARDAWISKRRAASRGAAVADFMSSPGVY